MQVGLQGRFHCTEMFAKLSPSWPFITNSIVNAYLTTIMLFHLFGPTFQIGKVKLISGLLQTFCNLLYYVKHSYLTYMD